MNEIICFRLVLLPFLFALRICAFDFVHYAWLNIHILFDRIINTLSDEVLRVYGHVPDWYYREHD